MAKSADRIAKALGDFQRAVEEPGYIQAVAALRRASIELGDVVLRNSASLGASLCSTTQSN
jgi:CO/xanthine dehydrogenase FAD-binding subunit